MSGKKKIVFVVNTVGMTGGIRVVFEYAKRLKNDGFDVKIIHLLMFKPGLKNLSLAMLKKFKWTVVGNNNIDWFDLAGVPINHQINLSTDADIIIATAHETAKPVNEYRSSAKKFYLIQGYENWGGKAADETYKLPLKKIVISTVLKDLLRDKFSEATFGVCPPGIELDVFNVENKKFNQNKVLCMLYHTIPTKGVVFGFEAVTKIQNKHPEVQLQLFGMYDVNEKLPANTTYTKNPNRDELKKIYQSSDIFIMPSLYEGFGLTAAEAMAAGCALVTTKTGGYADFSQEGESAVWVESGSSDAIAEAAIGLIEDNEKMQRIAKAGHKEIQNFSIDKAYENFKGLILN